MDEVIIEIVANIERYLKRAKDAYLDGLDTDTNKTKEGVVNLKEACAQSMALAVHIIKKNNWELSGTDLEVFDILAKHGFIQKELAKSMHKIVIQTNEAVDNSGEIDHVLIANIIKEHLDQFRDFCSIAIKSIDYKV